MSRAAVLTFALVGVALLVLAPSGAARRAENPKLVGTVGPDYSISLTDAQGNLVAKLDPGTYDIAVRDLSNSHNFHLSGPGVNQATPIAGMQEEAVTWTVTFVDGVYTYRCDAHPSTMSGTFTVGTPPSTSPPPPLVVTPKTKLVLTSGPSFSISLKTTAGKRVTKLKRGTYTITVRDRSQIHDAHLIAPGFNRATTVPFVGTKKWKVKLAKAGTLRFQCDVHAASGMRGSAKIV